MKAVRISGPNQLEIKEVDKPKPKEGEVLIRVLGTGICGTDVEILDGTMAYFVREMASYPVTPGHEWVGEVVELSDGIEGFEIGDRVVGECSVGCASCVECKSGQYHRCANRTETGILNRDGGFAEFIAFPALYLHKIDKSVPVASAALIEPTAIAFNGVKVAEVSPQDYLAIHGDGPIGLLILQVAMQFGAKKIAVVGATPERLELAKKHGANCVINAKEVNVVDALLAFGDGQLPNVSIEATGFPEAASAAMSSTKAGGRVVLQGLFGGRLLNEFDLDQIVINDLTVKGTLGSPNIWPDVIALVEAGKIDPSLIVTHDFALGEFKEAMDVVLQRKGIKVVVT